LECPGLVEARKRRVHTPARVDREPAQAGEAGAELAFGIAQPNRQSIAAVMQVNHGASNRHAIGRPLLCRVRKTQRDGAFDGLCIEARLGAATGS
jgi:hypothetical protein